MFCAVLLWFFAITNGVAAYFWFEAGSLPAFALSACFAGFFVELGFAELAFRSMRRRERRQWTHLRIYDPSRN